VALALKFRFDILTVVIITATLQESLRAAEISQKTSTEVIICETL
jgi:hypothetical protein